MPPAVVYGYDGKPLYSWRVLILPYIEEDLLYQRFKLDEPWDSPHNLQLLEEMPRSYAPPRRKQHKVPANHTVIHVFVGRGTPFEGRQGLRLPDDFPDGTSDTFLIVEGGPAVPWTKPEELYYDPDQPLPELCTLFEDCFRACMADATRRYVPKQTSEASLRAAITRNGKDRPGLGW